MEYRPDDQNVSQIFRSNVKLCLSLIGSKPESLALRCRIRPLVIESIMKGQQAATESQVTAICKDLGISKELILKDHDSSLKAADVFDEFFRKKGKLTSSSLKGKPRQEGEKTMPPQLQLSQGRLNDLAWRQNFGSNVRMCLKLTGKTISSLAIRTEMTDKDIGLILQGRRSVSNDDVEAIRSEIGLHTNDLIQDYLLSERREEMLRAKLTAAGRMPKAVQVEHQEPADALLAEDPLPETAIPQESPAHAPALPALPEPAIAPTTMETIMSNEIDIWDENYVVATIGARTFNLRKKADRKELGTRVKNFKSEKCPDKSWEDILKEAGIRNRALNWVHSVSYGAAGITGFEVEAFAKVFNVPVEVLLTGEIQSNEVADVADSTADVVSAVVLPDLSWSNDGTIARDATSGCEFNLSEGNLSQEVAQRVSLLRSADITVEQMLDESCIDETTAWFEGVLHGTKKLAEEHIEAFAEYFQVTDYQLLTGEGLALSEPEHGTAPDLETSGQSTEAAFDPPLATPQPHASMEEPDEDVSAEVEAEAEQNQEAKLQQHFAQLLQTSDYQLAQDVTPRAFLVATQGDSVDWCDVFYTMTTEGADVLTEVKSFVARLVSADATLGTEIFRDILSKRLNR